MARSFDSSPTWHTPTNDLDAAAATGQHDGLIARDDHSNHRLALRATLAPAITDDVRIRLAGPLVAAVLTLMVLPASAQGANFNIVNVETGWCLESDVVGDVNLNPCLEGNPNQLWERSDGGWTRNQATQRCLTASGAFSPGGIFTTSCTSGDPHQNWRHWSGGWYQRPGFTASGTTKPDECLSKLAGSVREVTGVVCDNPNGPNPPAELWLAVAVQTPPPAPPPPIPTVDPCALGPKAPGWRLRASFRRSRRVVTVGYGRQLTVKGRLLGGDGAPVGGAPVCVGVQGYRARAVRAAAAISTEANGRFSHKLGRGASRRVWFVHHIGDTSVATNVTVHVRAPVALRARPRSLRNGQSVVLRGRLRAGVGKRGLLVELQAGRGRRWQTFATTRTGRKGRFRYAYRFTRTVGVRTYRLRARISAQPGHPFATGASRARHVRVVG